MINYLVIQPDSKSGRVLFVTRVIRVTNNVFTHDGNNIIYVVLRIREIPSQHMPS